MPGLRAALPAALLLLLLSSFPPAAAEQPPWPRAPGVMRALNPSDRQASRAARTALHHFNYFTASPYQLRELHQVLKASFKDIPEVGVKYYLHFIIKDYISGENAGSCVATVLYLKKAPPEVYIKCTHTKDKKQIQEEDNRLYSYLLHRKKPIIANDIPDSHGNIDHSNVLVWRLAITGSSYIMLEKSTANSDHFMAQVKAAKQRLRKDGVVEFDFIILLHETPTQEIDLCHMHLIWTFGHPLRTKYICTSDNHGLEDGSGQDSGSAAGVFHEKEGNF